jgi:hypothetical protein
MSRIRTIKPDFFKSRIVAGISYRARLTWIGLWTIADDAGRLRWDTRVIAGELWPQEDAVTWREVDADMEELREAGLIELYTSRPDDGTLSDSDWFVAIPSWREHQRINKPTASKLPPPPGFTEDSRSTPVTFLDRSPTEGEGEREVEQGGGRGGRVPSPFCGKHPRGSDRPCRQCGDQRRAYELWAGAARRAGLDGLTDGIGAMPA